MLGGHLYGEPDASRAWSDTFVAFCTADTGTGADGSTDYSNGLGMYRSDADPSLFVRKFANGTIIDMLLHVDDGFVTYDCSAAEIAPVIASLETRFDMTIHHGTPDYFLGLNLKVISPSEMEITCESYVRTIVEEYLPEPLDTYPTAHTPAIPNDLMAKFETARDLAGSAICPKLQTLFRSIVGKLQYAASTARADILFATGILGRALTFCTTDLLDAAIRIAVYLARTPTLGLRFNGADEADGVLTGWCDSDWCISRSTSGCVFMLARAAIGAVSRRQQCISLSSTEAELMALSVAGCDIQYYRDLLHDLGVYQSQPTVLNADNKGANDLAHDYTKSSRSRHIQRRWFKIREFVHKGIIRVKQVPTLDNVSDFFTKVLDRRTFEKFRSVVMGTPAETIALLGRARPPTKTRVVLRGDIACTSCMRSMRSNTFVAPPRQRSVTFLRGLITPPHMP